MRFKLDIYNAGAIAACYGSISAINFIAVPAAMRIAVPQANMSLLLPMTLGVTFVFNIILGVPIYLPVINYVWELG